MFQLSLSVELSAESCEVPTQGCFVPEHDRPGGVGRRERPRCRYVFDCGNEGPETSIQAH